MKKTDFELNPPLKTSCPLKLSTVVNLVGLVEATPIAIVENAQFRHNYRNVEATSSKDEEDEEFYSPKELLNGNESSIGTESASKRAFVAVEVGNFNGSATNSSSTYSSWVTGSEFAYLIQSVSLSISSTISLSPRNSMLKSPDLIEIQMATTLMQTTMALKPAPNGLVLRESRSPSLSSSSSSEIMTSELAPSQGWIQDREISDNRSMAESKSGPEKEVKAPNVFERAKEEIAAVFHHEKHSNHHHKETHGLRNDLDENTSMGDVKAPNAFERAKEEIEAIVEAIRHKKESKSHGSSSYSEKRNSDSVDHLESKKPDFSSEKDVKAPNFIEQKKEDIESLMHKGKSPHHHHKETHGRSDDIDESTPISKVKGPNVLERAKEEIEALIGTIHPKKDSDNAVSSPKKEVAV
ncbi:unnamed protein product [Fraxinus pennsylvanica]|uniref:Uncharacterized protein n=1 Tax=Fraxinus pennsylvanica TaxID=56036 RepID=A0AAD1Z0U7_9LAMI|nr:unnamed protein product [Fraxinus pennsylvanica]